MLIFIANPSGRLIHYSRASGKTKVLLDKIWFTNGVALSPAEDFLVVSDQGRSKIVKVWLKDEKRGETETFAEGIPGVPDNLSSDKNGVWTALAVAVDPQHPLLTQSLANIPYGRKFIARILSLIELLFISIDKVVPNNFSKNMAHLTGSNEMGKHVTPNRCTILRFDWNGNIIAAYHGTGQCGYTHVLELDGHLYLGSFTNDHIAKVVKRAHL